MGLFDIFKSKKENTTVAAQTATTPTNTTVVTNTYTVSTPGVINMSKSASNLNKVLIDMSKTSKIDMSKHTARVALAMDYSGSMSGLFRNGSVQDTVTRLLPIALKFDDNGELESWLFSNGQEQLEPVTMKNYKDYVKKEMLNARMGMGGTNYAPVLKDILKYYKKVGLSTSPVFVMFITDGDNWDTYETDAIVREVSKYNIFIQFVGIGSENFNYLRKLDNLDGRECDNTGFIKVADMNRMDDETLYTKLLEQYKQWLNSK